MYSKAHTHKNLSEKCPIQNYQTQEMPFLLNFPLEYVIRKVQENQPGLKINWTPAAGLS
jgi:hypothetical protein